VTFKRVNETDSRNVSFEFRGFDFADIPGIETGWVNTTAFIESYSIQRLRRQNVVCVNNCRKIRADIKILL
jgi:hypothetical protein